MPKKFQYANGRIDWDVQSRNQRSRFGMLGVPRFISPPEANAGGRPSGEAARGVPRIQRRGLRR